MEHSIKKLEQYKNSPFLILSIYLGSPEAQNAPTSLMISRFHSLVHQYMTKKEQKLFTHDIERMERYLREVYERRGNKSIVFISSGERMFEVMTFPFYLQSMCVIAHSPYLSPIIEAVKANTSYGILLIDHKKARLFTVQWGKIEEHDPIENGDVPQLVKAKKEDYGRDDKIFRRHIIIISEAVEHFLKEHPVNFILLGGHKELFPTLKKHFPASLKKMVLGEFVSDTNVPPDIVFSLVRPIVEQLYANHSPTAVTP